MSVDRKTFLQLAVTGGLGALFGGLKKMPKHWTEKGTPLTTVQRQSLAMGSVISFQVVATTEADGYEAIRKALLVFRSLEKTFSMYDDHSEMAMLGRASGKKLTEVSGDALHVLDFAKQLYRASGGCFDITIEPAMRRWGFRQNPGERVTPPTDRELQNLEQLIGANKITITGNQVLLAEPGMAIDTGGIVGGYALDKAIETMRSSSIAAAFINFSGDIHCFGQPAGGQHWPVYIWDPQTQQPLTDPIQLNNEALSTSGAYQNRRHDRADDSWGHLLLPSRAEPVEPVSSLTAIHPSAMMADAWSTAAYVGAKPPREVHIVKLKPNSPI